MKFDTKTLITVGMCAALLAVLSQIAFPSPSGVPLTLQTFAVALTGTTLGIKRGSLATAVYLLLGTIGLPVFSNFNGGLQAIWGPTGGFLLGFLPMTALCAAVPYKGSKALGIALCMLGLLICHLLGILHFASISHRGFFEAAALVSLPYLIKDIISVAAAYLIGIKLKQTLKFLN